MFSCNKHLLTVLLTVLSFVWQVMYFENIIVSIFFAHLEIHDSSFTHKNIKQVCLDVYVIKNEICLLIPGVLKTSFSGLALVPSSH